jgi:hypothetical protein
MTNLMDRPASDLQEPADGLKSPGTPHRFGYALAQTALEKSSITKGELDRNTPDGCNGGEDCFYCTCPETD